MVSVPSVPGGFTLAKPKCYKQLIESVVRHCDAVCLPFIPGVLSQMSTILLGHLAYPVIS